MPDKTRQRPSVSQAPELPRIGNRSDALQVLETVMRKIKTETTRLESIAMGLAALHDALEREII
jgi:hypothetical protein